MNEKPNQEQIDEIKKWLDKGTINIFGSPFSGKDTQAKRLADILDAHTIGFEIVRAQNKRLSKMVEDGSLAPSVEYLEFILPYFSKEEFHQKPLILSSVGRWHGEEEGVMMAADQSGHSIKAVVYLKISEKEWLKRLDESKVQQDRGDRKDDSSEAREKRVQEFTNKTLPVIEYYKNKGLLVEIDGEPSREEVTNSIISALFAKIT